MDEAGITADDLEQVIIAGGLRAVPESEPRHKYRTAAEAAQGTDLGWWGNAAGAGARAGPFFKADAVEGGRDRKNASIISNSPYIPNSLINLHMHCGFNKYSLIMIIFTPATRTSSSFNVLTS